MSRPILILLLHVISTLPNQEFFSQRKRKNPRNPLLPTNPSSGKEPSSSDLQKSAAVATLAQQQRPQQPRPRETALQPLRPLPRLVPTRPARSNPDDVNTDAACSRRPAAGDRDPTSFRFDPASPLAVPVEFEDQIEIQLAFSRRIPDFEAAAALDASRIAPDPKLSVDPVAVLGPTRCSVSTRPG